MMLSMNQEDFLQSLRNKQKRIMRLEALMVLTQEFDRARLLSEFRMMYERAMVMTYHPILSEIEDVQAAVQDRVLSFDAEAWDDFLRLEAPYQELFDTLDNLR